jgi:hypothetical protein
VLSIHGSARSEAVREGRERTKHRKFRGDGGVDAHEREPADAADMANLR